MRGSEHAELRAFVAISDHGSFVRAAAHLGMSASALSQTIRSLEGRLGVRLLNRTTRSVRLSSAGERLLSRLRPALADLDAAVAAVADARETPSGPLRLNASRIAAIHYIAPFVGPFLAAYPEVKLDVVVDDRLVDIVSGGFDAGVRLGERIAKDMVAVKLSGDLEMMIVASPAYLARHGTPRSPHDLGGHRCLSYREPTNGSPYRWELDRKGEKLEVAVDGPLIVTEPEMLTQIAQDGAGIAYLFAHQVRDLVASGALVHLLQDWTPAFPGFYVYYPSRRHMAPPLRAFLDFHRRSAHHRQSPPAACGMPAN
ncbi:MAG: LysR family transcriptional regulator [Mesorhizobium sp.]|nr:LysR family transcriptional regulator [Mesorhizobium sp.]RWI50304.1 MAG: LysR family transcriptional regulator [Mesorhizobium sp.]